MDFFFFFSSPRTFQTQIFPKRNKFSCNLFSLGLYPSQSTGIKKDARRQERDEGHHRKLFDLQSCFGTVLCVCEQLLCEFRDHYTNQEVIPTRRKKKKVEGLSSVIIKNIRRRAPRQIINKPPSIPFPSLITSSTPTSAPTFPLHSFLRHFFSFLFLFLIFSQFAQPLLLIHLQHHPLKSSQQNREDGLDTRRASHQNTSPMSRVHLQRWHHKGQQRQQRSSRFTALTHTASGRNSLSILCTDRRRGSRSDTVQDSMCRTNAEGGRAWTCRRKPGRAVQTGEDAKWVQIV